MNKFRQGDLLSPQEALTQIAAGCWVYWNHKPQHPGWLGSMQINTIVCAAKKNMLRAAILNEEPKQ